MRKNALTAVAGCRIFDIQFVLDRVTAFNRCRWSCATSAPTGTTPIGSWSSGSSPWSRNWTSWAAVSIRHLSCSLRSCCVATRRSGGVGARTCHGSELTQSACKKCPFLNFFFLQVTWFQTWSEIIISSVSIRIHTRLQILCSQSCSRLSTYWTTWRTGIPTKDLIFWICAERAALWVIAVILSDFISLWENQCSEKSLFCSTSVHLSA